MIWRNVVSMLVLGGVCAAGEMSNYVTYGVGEKGVALSVGKRERKHRFGWDLNGRIFASQGWNYVQGSLSGVLYYGRGYTGIGPAIAYNHDPEEWGKHRFYGSLAPQAMQGVTIGDKGFLELRVLGPSTHTSGTTRLRPTGTLSYGYRF